MRGRGSPQPAYEAASVKPNTSGGNGSSSNGSKGQILMTNQSFNVSSSGPTASSRFR